MVRLGGYDFNLDRMLVKKGPDGEWQDIDELPYREKTVIEIIYTTAYILDEYADGYNIETEDEALKIAIRAREYMNDYHIDEFDAVEEALDALGYEQDEDEEEEEED